MRTLEEIAYEAGRVALADQEALVAGVRQRTGTLLAAHALVASFLGATAVRAEGLDAFGWVALGALVVGLFVGALLLAPWRLTFAVDARDLYDDLYEQAVSEAEAGTLGWLSMAGFSYSSYARRTQRRCEPCPGFRACLAFSWLRRPSRGWPHWR